MDQALERAVENGVKELVVQPTHLMHGAEYDEMVEAIEKYQDKFEQVAVAEPLLGEVGDDAAVINADKEAVAKAVVAEEASEAGFKDAAGRSRSGNRIRSDGSWYRTRCKGNLQPDADPDAESWI